MDVSAFMDGLDSVEAIAKLQCNFIDYVVSPLWTSIGVIFPSMQVNNLLTPINNLLTPLNDPIKHL